MALQAVRVYSHDMQNLPKTSPAKLQKKERKIISLKVLMKEDKILEVKGGKLERVLINNIHRVFLFIDS